MTSLAATQMLINGLSSRPTAVERRDGLRALLSRLAAIAQTETARRSLAGLPSHLRRDIGLGDINVLDF
jgi:hypothetical protein